ncbi:MAG: ABC transporter permease [Deltaproteobacteria bacterium]|nr:ABC transporter permease [Deltaproteobacteria bacterium]
MIRYIGRRLVTMIPTFFGITIVTFVLMHLPPGDPVAAQVGEGGMRASAAANAELIEEYRRAHFLDLPLFVNTRPDDMPKQVQRLVERLPDPERGSWAARQLVLRGGIILPVLLPKLARLPEEQRAGALAVLSRIAERIGATEDLEQAADPTAFWTGYWELHRIDFRPANADRLVRRYARRGSPAVLAELRTLDSFIVPSVVDALGRDPAGGELDRLSTLISLVTGREVVYRVGEPESRRRETIADWKEWWFKHESDYATFRGPARFVAMATETRYFKWASRIGSLSFGLSSRDQRPIADKLREKAPVTLLVASLSVFFAYLFAIPLGVFSAVRRGRLADRAIAVVLFVAASMPGFWVGMNLIRTIGRAGWLPIRGLTSAGYEEMSLWGKAIDLTSHLAMPVFCLTYVSIAALSRYQRVAMLEVVRQDYIRTARAKGVAPRGVIWKHAMRNALLPVVTLLGLQLPFLLGGSVIIEQLFSINGMGLETFEAILYRDYNWTMAVVTLSAVLTMAGVLVADILYALVDPRIGFGGRRSRGR